MQTTIQPAFQFLEKLAKNNNRDWFQANKEAYLNAHESVIQFAERLLRELRKFDHIETISGKKSLYRIYRDVRFSKDKRPYKTWWSGSFKRATRSLRGGYYFHIEPGKTLLAGGFFGPNKDDLKHIRNQIDLDDEPLRMVLENQDTKSYFVKLKGEKVKTAPRGFDKNHPSIDLLKYKQFILQHQFSDQEALSPDFHLQMADGFKKLLPFFDVMSEMLTTDLNGNSLL